MPIKVSIVEEDDELRNIFSTLLNRAGSLHCVKTYAAAEEALQEIPLDKWQPDVVLMDINLPDMNAVECVAKLKEQSPDLKILMLTLNEHDDCVFDSIRAGASGYLLKRSAVAKLVEAIEEVHAGEASMTTFIARRTVDCFRNNERRASSVQKPTLQEWEILEMLAMGHSFMEISRVLGISLPTVRAYLYSVYKKVHVIHFPQLTGRVSQGMALA
jgi:DNA-binding NarL/FixJ family response regulator